MRSRILVLAAFTAVIASSPGVHGQKPILGLTLECEQSPELTFRLSIRNISTVPASIMMGTVLGNDRTYMVQGLGLTIRRPGRRRSSPGAVDQEGGYSDPSWPGVVGERLDPWLVALPKGASYSLALPASHFSTQRSRETFSVPAEVRLQLQLAPLQTVNLDLEGRRFIKVWTGTLTSNWIQTPSDCRR
jgi:hypothetical protein